MQEYILAVAIKTWRTTARLRSLKHLEIHMYVLCASLEYGDVALVAMCFVRKTPRLRDLFRRKFMGEEHSATTFFSVSRPPFSRSVFFGRVIEVRLYIERISRLGRPWCAAGWQPAKAVSVDKCPFNREEVSLFTLCFLSYDSLYTVYHRRPSASSWAGSHRQLKIGHEHT